MEILKETLRAEEQFNPEMLLGTLVMVEFRAEGYYSGNTESQVAFFHKDDYEIIQEAFVGFIPTFSELDGKHSEVDGTVTITEIKSINDLKMCIGFWENSDDDYMIFESCLDYSEFSDRVLMLSESHADIINNFATITTVEYYVHGVKI